MKNSGLYLLLLAFVLFCANTTQAKDKKKKGDNFGITPLVEIERTSVKDQASSGTCWSYSTVSFIEAELLRMGKGEHDLSEMFFVRMAYPQKAQKYLRYHGLANFSQGGQGHDVTNIINEFGIIPEEFYTGLNYGFDYHQHSELASILKGILDNSLKRKSVYTGKSVEVFNAALDIYLGEVPDTFTYNEKDYTPISFAKDLGLDANNYIEITSYKSYPYYKAIDLELPDNWSHDEYYNLPIDDMMQVVENAFANGYSINWDGDVSGEGFSHKNALAILPEDNPENMEESERLKWDSLSEEEQTESLYEFDEPIKEKEVTQDDRQKAFDKYTTTDDHLMHLVGTAEDKVGTKYFITKNSWASDSNKKGGYLYMSESYFKLNTTAIQIHKEALPENIKAKLGL